MTFKTPYVPHTFGKGVEVKFKEKIGWLNAGVASSIPWPSSCVCVNYAGDEFFLRGSEINGASSPPCISIATPKEKIDEALGKIYRFTSLLSWFMDGYVDVSGYTYSGRPSLYKSRNVYSSLGIFGTKSFNCNHLPIVEDENVRKALAFWREGKRLDEVHDSYSFLSFYKVIESQFTGGKTKGKWIDDNIEKLEGPAADRVAELRASGVHDVGTHLNESGRCAVAHATLGGKIVDPDVPEDRRRLSADLVVIEGLARNYIQDVLKVPTSRTLYASRNRLEPWKQILTPTTFDSLQGGGGDVAEVSKLTTYKVSIGLWPDGVIPGLENMTLNIDAVENGVVKIVLISEKQTIALVFFLDFKNGKAHTHLSDGGYFADNDAIEESDVRAYSTFFYKVFSNGIAELTIDGFEPVDCEVVIPTNMYMKKPANQAIEDAVQKFREEKTKP